MHFLDYLESVNSLSFVQRYSMAGLSKPENTLEHTGQVALLCLYIGKELQQVGQPVDVGTLLQKAILHDFEESVTGDIPRPVKHANKAITDEIKNLEKSYIAEMDSKVCSGSWVLNIWLDSKSGFEGNIVALADAICVVKKFHYEVVMRGNKTMKPLMHEDLCRIILDRIQKCRSYINNLETDSIFKDIEEVANKLIREVREVE